MAKPMALPALLPLFSYRTVELALTKMHEVKPEHVSAWRARFGAFQRHGLLGAQPGSGRKVAYAPDHLHRLVFAFELAQAGIVPSIILSLVENFWAGKLKDIFRRAEHVNVHGGSDVVLYLAGLAAMIDREGAIPNINHTTMDRLGGLALGLEGDGLPARALVINVSAQLRKFHLALAEYHPQRDDFELDRPTPKAKPKRTRKR
jgi:hypothetical protein